MSFEFFDHTADIGVRISAASPGALLAEAVRAFYAILLEEGSPLGTEERVTRTVDLAGPDGETVLVDLLNELIYRFDSEKLLLPVLRLEEVRLRPDGRVRGRLAGERFDPGRHRLATEVKAATWHGLRIEEDDGELRVDVIFDL